MGGNCQGMSYSVPFFFCGEVKSECCCRGKYIKLVIIENIFHAANLSHEYFIQ